MQSKIMHLIDWMSTPSIANNDQTNFLTVKKIKSTHTHAHRANIIDHACEYDFE